jgi:hypothetical protein
MPMHFNCTTDDLLRQIAFPHALLFLASTPSREFASACSITFTGWLIDSSAPT